MDAKWYRQLGVRIARLRARQTFTQEELAEKANIAPSYLARIEAGTRRATLDVLGRLASALDVPLHRLLADDKPSRAAEGAEPWGRPTRQLIETIRDLEDGDLDLLLRLATRLRR